MPKRPRRPTPAVPPLGRRLETATAFFAGAAVLASWVAIDPRSIDGFDAPKTAIAATALAAAAVCALARRIRASGGRLPRLRLPVILLLAALAAAVVSALASPHRGQSLATLRTAAFFLLALPVGASAGHARGKKAITAIYGAAAAVNGALVVLAGRRIYSPVSVYGNEPREGLGALVGNAGHAGVSLAIAAVTLAPIVLRPGRGRVWAGAALAIIVAGMLATQSLSAIAIVASGLAAWALFAGGRRARIRLGSAVALLLLAAALYGPVRRRAGQFVSAVRSGNWNAAVTARAAPWLAAREMIRRHPVLGIGVGAYRSEYVAARLAAETRGRRRLVLAGMRTNSFAQAHDEYLDAAAGAGIPAALAAIAAAAILLVRCARRAPRDPEAADDAAILAGGAVAAFTWFPFQIAPSGVWLLLRIGDADRLQSKDDA